MGRKVFISFLGTGNYGFCKYYRDDYKSDEIRFIQEATLEYLLKKGDTNNDAWNSNDVTYILLTKDAENTNWVNNGHINKDTKLPIPSEGLQTRLKKMRFPMEVKTIDKLPDGNNETEIWEIFNRVFTKIENGDHLYFDLTHGYRYLPMLILVLGNYSRFLKDVTVESITYGNYEGRNKKTNEAPIINLIPLDNLQTWTFTAGQYIESGNTKRLPDDELYLPLKNVIADFHTCRGIEIIKGNHIKEAKEKLDEVLANCPKAVVPIVKAIEKDLQDFSSTTNVKNGYQAALWCKKNDLIQQAITILEETVISNVLFAEGIKWDVKKNRDIVSNCFSLIHYKSKDYRYREKEGTEKRKQEEQLVEQMYNSTLLNKLVGLMVRIKSLRDDIDHAGMRENAQASKDFKDKCEELFDKVKEQNLC